MLLYNTQLKRLILPEYGRNIQQMVDHCKTIENRDERNQCAYSIVKFMGRMFSQIKQESGWERKLWDHLAIMSDFSLDVDYPYTIVDQHNLHTPPETVPYNQGSIKFRHYGKIIEHMIARATEYPEGPEREALVMLIANHMKKLVCAISGEDVDDRKIFNDLFHYSKGQIRLDPATHQLHQYQIIMPVQGKKKRKK